LFSQLPWKEPHMAEKIVIRPLDKKETTGDSNSQGA
jgi:hypothetical protein